MSSSSMSLLPLLSISLLLLTKTYSSFSPNCEPFMCGNINISYPFSRYENTTTEHCGLPGFLVSCEYNTPILHLHDESNYTVLDINYKNYTITLVDTDVLNNTCPRVRHNVSLFTNSGVKYTSSDVNLYFFFGCNTYNGVIDPTPISCLSSVNGDSFVLDSNTLRSDPALYNNLTNFCSEVVEAQVLEDSLYQNSTDLNTYFGKALQSGFQLGWEASTDNCTKCLNYRGQCGYTLLEDNTTFNFNCLCANGSCDRSKKKSRAAVIGALVTAAVVFFLLFSVLFFLYMRRKRQENLILSSSNYAIKVNKNFIGERKKGKLIEVTLENFGSLAPKKYTFSEIRKITKSFNQKIGQGGYASVFKGELMDGSPVAVKVFKDRESTGVEFISEVMSIARTSHVNIVRLLGFSTNGSKRALIYEFMSNGSLDKYLRESQNSTSSDVECTGLFDIAVGIARGLEYLHRGCNTRIVHFDIKPHNILLDQDYCPKISDFGLAKFCQPKESIISMSGMRGTIGYIAPEVFSRNFGAVSSKSDVYSYGMMLLEMFVGKQGKMELKEFSSTETYFPEYIYKCVEQNNICSVYGISAASEEVVRKATTVGLWCIQMMPNLRPTMSSVLDMLDRRVEELTLPPASNVTLAPVLVQEATDITAPILYDQ